MVKPLIINDDDENKVSLVFFHMQDISPSIIPWMKEGDELTFDLAREHLDNTYCIQSPTLTKLALPGRAEGTITALKEGFGFISLAERQADVYFRLSDNVLPSCMQKFLLKDSIDDDDNDDNNNTPHESTAMAIGTEVSFDLSLACNNKNNNNMHHRNDKENLKAHRILPLPKGSITIQKTIATKVKGVITQLHNSVYLELDESVQGMTFEEHHPLIASMINSFIADKDSDDNDNVINDIVFTDVQSPHESRFIITLAESKGLNVSFAFVRASSNPAEYWNKTLLRSNVDPHARRQTAVCRSHAGVGGDCRRNRWCCGGCGWLGLGCGLGLGRRSPPAQPAPGLCFFR